LTGNTDNEKKLYGETWNTVYGGYFADSEMARPLVSAVLGAVDESGPSVIADLGGGTGFVLGEIGRAVGPARNPRLVCVDSACEQLDDCPEQILTVQCPVERVKRVMLAGAGESILLCIRSVLHYFGEAGLAPVLADLRAVLSPGEYLVHQSLCFEDPGEQEIANLLYEMMDTGKWYPTVGGLVGVLEASGLRVVETRRAESLAIESEELVERYGVEPGRMEEIGRELARRSPETSRVFVARQEGFTVVLDYTVMTCVAVEA
jgi:hypothetical protein